MIDKRLAFPALQREGCFQTKGHSAHQLSLVSQPWLHRMSSGIREIDEMKPMDGQTRNKKIKSMFFFYFMVTKRIFLKPYGVRATGACLGFHVAPVYLGEGSSKLCVCVSLSVTAVSNCISYTQLIDSHP